MTVFARLLLTASLLGGLAAVPAYSATSAKAETSTTAPKAKTAQQERMTTCNQHAKDMKGDERKAFMSSCLKGETSADGKALTSSQQRMKTCNADATAKALKGDERKAFMSTCLKAN